jgi:hypothetical protein
MSKKIEEYVREHRKAFDVESPSEQLWSRIENELNREKLKKPSRVPFWLGIAASLIVLMTATFIFTYRNHSAGTDIAELNPSFAKKEMRFASLIEEKKDSLQVYAKENPALYEEFSADLEKLGAEYRRLKKELESSPNQRVIVNAMVKNLKLQLQVISQQLDIINEVNQYKKENRI